MSTKNVLNFPTNETSLLVAEQNAKQLTQDLGVFRNKKKMDVAFISQFVNGHRIFKYVDSESDVASIKSIEGEPLEETLCKLLVEEKIPSFIPDIDELDNTKNVKSVNRLNIRSYLGVPIRLSNGELYGTFCCFSHTPRWDLSANDVEFMNMFAEITSKRLEQELQHQKENRVIEERIKNVLESDEVSQVFQPIFNIENNKIDGFEALSRFNHDLSKSPDLWFNDAAKVGLGVDLEIKAIKLALKAIKSLPSPLYLSINSSATTILSNRLDIVLDNFPINRIILEITEHQSIDHYEGIIASLKPLRDKGLKLAVDDAGAGYASFRHILSLAPEYIKIDISIIRNIHQDYAKQSLAKAFITFAEQTNSTLIAEGVESNEELATLKALGFTKAQGYLLGRPMPIEMTTF